MNDLISRAAAIEAIKRFSLKPHAQNIGYECDRLACMNCHPETCSHTTDIRHAKNFALLGDDRYMEQKK